MNKKEFQEYLWTLWKPEEEKFHRYELAGEERLDVRIWQKKPNTAVAIEYFGDKECWLDYGFTKVQYPDVWNSQYGIDLAIKKALASIARQIVGDENENSSN